MSLLDSQGRPLRSTPQLDSAKIVQGFTNLDQRITYVGQTQVEHGLLLEYLVQKLVNATDADGNPLVSLDLNEEFQAFAQTRMNEIRKDIEEVKQAVMAKQHGVNLDDEDGAESAS